MWKEKCAVILYFILAKYQVQRSICNICELLEQHSSILLLKHVQYDAFYCICLIISVITRTCCTYFISLYDKHTHILIILSTDLQFVCTSSILHWDLQWLYLNEVLTARLYLTDHHIFWTIPLVPHEAGVPFPTF